MAGELLIAAAETSEAIEMHSLVSRPSPAFALTFACTVVPANAQVLDEIIVTAQKREQNLQDVSIAVSAFTTDELRSLGMTSSIDVAQQVPGVRFVEGSEQLVTISNIRGVSQNDVSFHLEPPNAVYVDQAYLSVLSAANFQMFDLERVEVLRGPQGTLFGRNATGGLFHYLSNAPTKNNEGYADLWLGQDSLARVEGAASGALSDTISGRVSGVVNTLGDYAYNTTTGEGFRGRNERDVRGQLLFEPSDSVAVRLIGLYGDLDTDLGYKHSANGFDSDGLEFSLPATVNHYGNCAGCDPSGHRDATDDPYVGEFETSGFLDAETKTVTATVTYDMGATTLTSVTSFLEYEAAHLEDGELAPRPGFNLHSGQDVWQRSQEVRVAGAYDRIIWIAGAYLLDRDGQFVENVDVNLAYADDAFSSLGAAPPGFLSSLGTTDNLLSQWALDTRSWAIFGQLEYAFTDELNAVVGLRRNDDSHDYEFISTESIDGFPIGPGGILGETSALRTQDEDDWSGKAALEWRPRVGALWYLSYSQATKSGGFNAPFLGGDVTEFGPETLSSFEVGYKVAVMNERVNVNSAAFVYDYSDYQGFTFVNLAPTVANMDAEAKGLEVELHASLGEGWDVGLGMSYLDSTLKDVVLPSGRVTDRELPLAPESSFNGFVSKAWPAFDGTFTVLGDLEWIDEHFSDALNNPSGLIDARTVVNARLSYTPNQGRWSAALIARNLTDEEVLYYRTPTGFGFNQDHYGRQRTFVAEWVFRWE